MAACFVPPLRFEEVEPKVYRGAYPTLRNFPFLASLGLRTIISIVPEKPTKDLENFARKYSAQIVWRKVSKYKEAINVHQDKARDILEALIKQEAHPLYIHCVDGQHVTGLVIMCLRKLQHWSKAAMEEEFSRFVPERCVSAEEARFIANFDGGDQGLLLPLQLPNWLWQGVKIPRHPSIRIVTRRLRLDVKKSKSSSPPEPLVKQASTVESHMPIFFVDPISSTDEKSVARFDSLLCTPQNIRFCMKTRIQQMQRKSIDLGYSSPHPALREGTPQFSPTDLNAENVKFFPNSFLLDLLHERNSHSQLLKALDLEDINNDISDHHVNFAD